MPWEEEEEESEFGWKEEDEEEVPEKQGPSLSIVRPIGIIILLGLVVLFLGSLLLRLVAGLSQLAQ